MIERGVAQGELRGNVGRNSGSGHEGANEEAGYGNPAHIEGVDAIHL